LGDARDASMFPETLETDRLRLERYCHDTATPREVYDAFGRPSPTVEAETEFLPWDPLDTVGAAADRLDRFERLRADRDRAEWLIDPVASRGAQTGVSDEARDVVGRRRRLPRGIAVA